MIKRKGGAGWAVGIAIRDVVHAVLLDKKALLPVSSLVIDQSSLEGPIILIPSRALSLPLAISTSWVFGLTLCKK